MAHMRLNKYLSKCGYCSRRRADRLIEAGLIKLNGEDAELGAYVVEGNEIVVEGKSFIVSLKEEKRTTYLFYKPKGVICTLSEHETPNLLEYFEDIGHVFPVGRLDKDSEGLLLMTNDGDLALEMTHPSFQHGKKYQVKLTRVISDGDLIKLSKGIDIDDYVTQPCRVERRSKTEFFIWLKEGKNRQIRRMLLALDYRVSRLRRVAIGRLSLILQTGEVVELTQSEIKLLYLDE
ncbi:MAG: 23S rRNA pseudouridine synthase F [Candidatus Cloacimonadota bacterium]|nr:MAG: 23S rRNA pseudouridine synthase F [Candidatus Cloacimonadota bacterium]